MKQVIKDNDWLISQWDWEKNKDLYDPNLLTVGSNKKPWWKCNLGHSYVQQINTKNSQKQGCPYCSGKKILVGFNDLATTDPDIAKEWSSANETKPTEVTRGTKKKAVWQCSKCKQTWVATINSRAVNRTGCPYCTHQKPIKGKNDLATKFPAVAKEWDAERNKDHPSDYLPFSKHVAFWRCPICQNNYSMIIQNRTQQNQGCPKCAKRWQTSFPEQAIYYYIKKTFPDCKNKVVDIISGNYELDIYIPSQKIAIEYDGQRWHREKESEKVEKKKYEECKKNNITLIRVRESRLKTTEGIADYVVISEYDQGKKIQQMIPIIQNLGQILNKQIEIDIFKDEIEIRNQYINGIRQTSAGFLYPELKEEWDSDNNKEITLFMISPGDGNNYYWKCKQCGFRWKTSVKHRIEGKGCPKCGRKRAAINNTKTKLNKNGSLVDLYPEIAGEWDYEKNKTLDPTKVTSKTNQKVWWICKKGHSYQANISDRTSKSSGCPFCAGKQPVVGENDLGTTNPELIIDWNYEKNGLPSGYKAGSNKKVWWICHTCGYEWQTPVYSRAQNGRGCRECAKRSRQKKK